MKQKYEHPLEQGLVSKSDVAESQNLACLAYYWLSFQQLFERSRVGS